MKGSLRKRSKGSWEITIDIGRDPATGKRMRHFESVTGRKADAQNRLAELLVTFEQGNFVKSTKLTLAQFLEEWLHDYVRANTGPRTAERYQEIVKIHLIPALGRLPLLGLQPRHIQKYYAEALDSGRRDGKGGLSAQTVHHHHRVLYAALKYGVKHGVLSRNVAEAVDAPRPEHRELSILRANEIRLILDATNGTPYYAIFFVLAYTGLRRSELLGLRWADIDLEKATLSVVQTLHQLRGGKYIFRQPKNKRSRRQIALSPKLAIMLWEHRFKQEQAWALLSKPLLPTDLVFSHPDGRPIRPDSVTRAFNTTVRSLDLKGVRLHDLRHAHATILLEEGVHPKVVQERLGHSSISTTLDIYSHVVPSLQQAAARKIDEGLEGGLAKEHPVEVNQGNVGKMSASVD